MGPLKARAAGPAPEKLSLVASRSVVTLQSASLLIDIGSPEV